jgi:hypothetical protein
MDLKFKQKFSQRYFVCMSERRDFLLIDYDIVYGSVDQYRPRITHLKPYRNLSPEDQAGVDERTARFIAAQNVIRRLRA